VHMVVRQSDLGVLDKASLHLPFMGKSGLREYTH
jgi:hypothetical protein